MSTILINGSKNTALPIIAATLLKKSIYRLKNIPLIEDVNTCLNILKQFNVDIKFDNNELVIDTTMMQIPDKLEYNSNTRGTYYFICSTIHYNTTIKFMMGNGCNIDNANRKIDYHLELITMSGKNYTYDSNDNSLCIYGNFNYDQDIYYRFKKPSVGATINAMFIFSKINITSVFENYAKDPYIYDVINFLSLQGCDIYYDDTKIIINGKNNQNNISNEICYSIIMDPIEIISYIICAAINLQNNTISPYTIKPITIKHLGKTITVLKEIGIELIETNEDDCYYIQKNTLKPFNITTGYFPDVYTDVQPFFCILSLYINGICKINETIWDNRFNYVNELNKLGYNIEICNNNSTIIIDTAKINITMLNKNDTNIQLMQPINCTDLRGGMALYMLLITNDFNFDFTSNFKNKHIIDRGYYNYESNIKTIIDSSSLNTIKTNYSTINLSNIKIGGIAKYYSEFETIDQLCIIMNFCKNSNTNFKIIGGGYNIYFNDYFDGIIIKNNYKDIRKLTNCDITQIYDDSFTIINVSSGTELSKFIYYCANNNIDISELSGIPGTIGGSIYGNAGAYGLEISNFINKCYILNSENNIECLKNNELNFIYRDSIFKMNKTNKINITNYTPIISVDFAFKKDMKNTKDNIINKIESILNIRNNKFIYTNTLGSIFKNIILHDKKIFAWELIDSMNLRGKIKNNLLITNNHPNIFINTNNASPSDINDLINQIIYFIKQHFKLHLETEIECI